MSCKAVRRRTADDNGQPVYDRTMEQILIHPMTTEAQNESIRRTVRKERRRLLDFIRRRVSSEADAEDILQDVFYQFVAAMQLEPIERAASWLFQVAGNRIIDWYRRRRYVSLDVAGPADTNDDVPLPPRLEEMLFDRSESPDTIYLRSTVWSLLAEALDDLPHEQREVFILHELEDKSFREIAEITGVPVNTLLSRKRYAVLYLRERLREVYDDLLRE